MEKNLSVPRPPKEPTKSNMLNYVQFSAKQTPLPVLLGFPETLGHTLLTYA